MADFATIGIYEFDAAGFLAALRGAGVDVVVDVRQRRGVRGPQYVWANARRLQAALEEAGIDYVHRKDLAPSTEMRQILYRADAERGERQRTRTTLAPEYVRRYEAEVLDRADLDSLAELARERCPALLCLERDPRACHRSLIAARLQRDFDLRAEHLRPD